MAEMELVTSRMDAGGEMYVLKITLDVEGGGCNEEDVS